MSNYPTDGNELLEPPVKFKDETIEAVTRFKTSRPWTGTIEERKSKFEALHVELCQIYGKHTTLRFGDLSGDCSGSSFYNRLDDVIVLQGKLSVVTYLHEYAHVLGRYEPGAVRWSVCLFREVFPEEFAKCHFEGHMLRKNPE